MGFICLRHAKLNSTAPTNSLQPHGGSRYSPNLHDAPSMYASLRDALQATFAIVSFPAITFMHSPNMQLSSPYHLAFLTLCLTALTTSFGINCNGLNWCHNFPSPSALSTLSTYISGASNSTIFTNNELIACLPGTSLHSHGGLCAYMKNTPNGTCFSGRFYPSWEVLR